MGMTAVQRGYRAAALLLLVAVALVTTACSASEETTTTVVAEEPAVSLSGEWERVDSTFASLDGMVIRIDSGGTEAIIVSVPDNEFQFAAGDVKWRNIERTSDTEFTFEDLVREAGSGATSYIEGVLTVDPDGTRLEATFPTSSTIQEWQLTSSG